MMKNQFQLRQLAQVAIEKQNIAWVLKDEELS